MDSDVDSYFFSIFRIAFLKKLYCVIARNEASFTRSFVLGIVSLSV